MATEIGDLNVIQDEDTLRRMVRNKIYLLYFYYR